jgi:hypothetical protein
LTIRQGLQVAGAAILLAALWVGVGEYRIRYHRPSEIQRQLLGTTLVEEDRAASIERGSPLTSWYFGLSVEQLAQLRRLCAATLGQGRYPSTAEECVLARAVDRDDAALLTIELLGDRLRVSDLRMSDGEAEQLSRSVPNFRRSER